MEKPWIVWGFSVIQLAVFIAEFIKMGVLTGTPVQTQPSFNPMIGPSGYLLINMGARFTPCMHAIEGITDTPSLKFPCPNSTTTDTNTCSLQELCGMGGLGDPPNQWWRFITPIFLHAGIIHISFNLLLQIKLGSEIERSIGHIRFLIIYLAAGIGGFVFGGNFTPDGIVSTGASGSLFGVIALELLDLLFKWQLYEKPVRALLLLLVEIIISFGIGLLPGLDNFSHIGGFVIGLLLGIALLRSPLFIRKQAGNSFKDQQEMLNNAETGGVKAHWLNPATSFKNRSPLWYGWIVVRVAAIVIIVVYFVTLIKQFENGGGNCSWCKYLSCIPVKDWCNVGNIQVSNNGYTN
jgi:membrane associated rhomboid family serine protease